MNVKINISDVFIKTERLVLRAFADKDLEDFFEYARVDGVGEMAGWPHHETIEDSKVVLDMFLKEKKHLLLNIKERLSVP